MLNVIDDHSRFLVASVAYASTKAFDVEATFSTAGAALGWPASVLTDIGAMFTAEARGGRGAVEALLGSLGVVYKHAKPYHPQTQGKVERFHQTLKRWLAEQQRPADLAVFQAELDWSRAYYNDVRPHRALGRRTPAEAFGARAKAHPTGPLLPAGHYRQRWDRVGPAGKVTQGYQGRLHHIGIGRAHAGARVMMLIAGADVRVMTTDGEFLGRVVVDSLKNYQPLEKDVVSTMS